MELFWSIVAWTMYGSFCFVLLGAGYTVSLETLNLRCKVPQKVDEFVLKVFGVSYGVCSISAVLMTIWAVFFKK